jgi:hypothetical protein
MTHRTFAGETKAIRHALIVLTLLGAVPCSAGTDFNNDKRDDIITFVRDSQAGTGRGDVYVALSSGSAFGAGVKWHDGFCLGLEIPATGDFNGDGKDDIAAFVRDTASGAGRGDVYVALSNGSGFGAGQIWHNLFSIGNEIPMVGDFNGDHKDDIVTFLRDAATGASRGDVCVALSTGSGFGAGQIWHDYFSIGNEIPMVGDFNGDGKDDIATFLRSTASGAARGDVYVALSTGSGFGAGRKWHDYFAIGNQIPMVGDFNGDGKDDIAAFVRDTSFGAGRGDVYVATSTGSAFAGTGVKWHEFFGVGNEIPMVGDFNGDGKDDIATFVHETKPGAGRGDVYVAASTGSAFGEAGTWHDFFSIDDEMPTTLAAVFPQYIFAVSYEDKDSHFVGYASNEESRFYKDVWDFIDEFKSTWPYTQYYWGQRRFLQEDHLKFVDSADLAFISGHGNVSSIDMSAGQGTNLEKCAWGSWSSNSRKGDLEYIAFESCRVLSLDGDWTKRWKCRPNKRRPFAGLHVAAGFKSDHWESPVYQLSDEFAENLEEGYNVRWAWLDAADDENDWVWGYDNFGCVIYVKPYQYETRSQHAAYDRWYHDSDYVLEAHSWNY